MTDDYKSKLIVALDPPDAAEAKRLVEALAPLVGWFKIGSVLFTREGPSICRLVKSAGANLFLDLKFHDIPNTVKGAVSSAVALDADMLTVHLSGGEAMLRAAVEAKKQSDSGSMMIVGVTVLTHLTFEDFHSIFATDQTPENTVLSLAKLARQTGLDGIVASARELPLTRSQIGAELKIITPGIRLADASTDDQTRVATPAQAMRDGADYIVVGRPIIAAADPADACRRILDDMSAATPS